MKNGPTSIKLDLRSALAARRIGLGNLSMGVRECIDSADTEGEICSVYKGPCVYYSVNLSGTQVKKAIRAGDGNLSLGVRYAIFQLDPQVKSL